MTITDGPRVRRVDRRWTGYQGLFGGYVVGLLVDAALEATSHRLASFSANFVSAVAVGDVAVQVDRLHRGRSTEVLRLVLRQGERVCVHATAELVGGGSEGAPFWVRSGPSAGPPPSWGDQGRVLLPFDDLFEVRRADAPRLSSVSCTWVRLRPEIGPPGLVSDEALLAVLLDLPTPGLFGEAVAPLFVPTVEYTLHFPPRDDWGPRDWIRLEHATTWATTSHCADDVTAWDGDGRQVAMARQTRSIRWGDDVLDLEQVKGD